MSCKELDLERLDQAIVRGLEWLATPQPDNVVVTHHGEVVKLSECFWLGVAPKGSSALMHLNCRDERFDVPFTETEWDDILKTARKHGDIADWWNGPGYTSGSFVIPAEIAPSLTAAVQRYHAGCLIHPQEGVFCECDDWKRSWRTNVKLRPLEP